MICDECGEESEPTRVDFGIGDYEYAGARGTHHAYAEVSACCEAPLVEGGVTLVRRATHVARRDHGKCKAGDRYEVEVYRHHRRGGASWLTTRTKVLVPGGSPG